MTELPPQEVTVIDGEVWYKEITDDNVIRLGHAPRPRNSFEGFVYHMAHGLIMRYPLLSVIKFSWHNRNAFQDTTEYHVNDYESL